MQLQFSLHIHKSKLIVHNAKLYHSPKSLMIMYTKILNFDHDPDPFSNVCQQYIEKAIEWETAFVNVFWHYNYFRVWHMYKLTCNLHIDSQINCACRYGHNINHAIFTLISFSILNIQTLYVYIKAPPRVCMKNTAQGGCVERQIQHEVKPSAVFVSRHPPSAVFFIQTSKAVL